MSAPTKRQALPWPWWRRWIREVIWSTDADDGSGDGSPSMAKMIAWWFAILLVVAVLAEKPISGTQLTFAIVILAAAFGRSMYKAFLARGSWATSAHDATTRLESRAVQEILERRKLGGDDATEPT